MWDVIQRTLFKMNDLLLFVHVEYDYICAAGWWQGSLSKLHQALDESAELDESSPQPLLVMGGQAEMCKFTMNRFRAQV